MYLDYFGFDEPPFSITPDPKFVYLSEKHQESLAHLVYGITRGGGAGFVQLTGEVGTGKTTISRLLLSQIPDKTNIALILNPTITPIELLENICKELKIPLRGIKGKLNSMVDKLNEYLLKSWSAGENTVVIIDEAQNLPRDTLEQLRLLTNLETDKQKLLQIVLIGQPELRSTMRRNDLRQLAQRVTARYHLMPLSAAETYEYLQHRIKVAGGNPKIISQSAANSAYKLTQGVPRLINILLDRALLAAYSDNANNITSKHLKIAAPEVMPETYNIKSAIDKITVFKIVAMLLAAVAISVLVSQIYFERKHSNTKDIADIADIAEIADIADIEKHKSTSRQVVQNTAQIKPANKLLAWQNYFKLWDASIEKQWSKSQCPKNTDTAMACLRRQGNFKQIEKLNHPVLLQLNDGSLVLLSEIKNDKVGILNQNEKIELINKDWINEQWFGTYFIIWPMPPELLLDPSKEQLQSWSLEMANTIANNKISLEQLGTWIIQFQQQNGLLADGIIGSETQMALSLNAYNGPTLKK